MSQAKIPLVSFIIPCTDDSNPIPTIKSILSCDSNSSFEILLVFDIDIPPSVGKWQEIKMLTVGSRRGPGAARNKGIAASSGSIVAFVDSDIIVGQKWLDQIVRALLESETVAGVCGRTILTEPPAIYPFGDAPEGNRYETCNIAYKKDVLLAIGGFDERYDKVYMEDVDLALRVLRTGAKIDYCESAVAYHAPRVDSLRKALSRATLHRYEPLLFREHGRVDHVGTRITRPVLGPFSLLGIAFLAFTAITIASLYRFALYWLVFCLLAWLAWASFYAVLGQQTLMRSGFTPNWQVSKTDNSPRREASLARRLEAGMIIPIFVLVSLVARIYGSVTYRKLML